MMRLWSEGFAPGFLFAQCAGGVLAVLLAGGGGDAPWAAGLCAAAALAAGLGACLAQQAGRFAAFALIAFLQQGAAAAFLGDPASALLFMTFFPLGAFALYAVARAGRREGGDIRERAELRLPKWAGWCLTAALCGILGGILPGPVLAVRLRVLAELWEGGAWGLAGTAALLGSVCCLLIGSVRWTAWRDGGPSAPVPRHVRAALWACLAALIAPAALQLLFLRGFVPASGWFLPLAVLAPAAALACLVRWGTGDGVTRLDRSETELNEAAPGDQRDTTSPRAMVADIRKLALGDGLKPASREKLVGWMKGCKTGAERMRAKLPPGWTVGDKTGSGERGTMNDVGVVWPPDGAPIVLAIYFTGSDKSAAERAMVIQEVGRAVAAAVR